jgi:chromosome segregation ATPase
MLEGIAVAWAKVQEFMKRLGALEEDSKETRVDVDQLKRELALLQKELTHNGKIQDHHAQLIGDLQARIKKLESEKHGALIAAGKAKAQNKRLKDQLRTDH